MATTPALLLHFDDETEAAARLAQAGGFACACIERHRFPDDELRLRLPPRLPPQVLLLRSLHRPNEKLVELMLAARGARALGAQRLGLVAPYLAYMRQDFAFREGEVVSQRIVGDFLAVLFDALLTVDPHLHRIDHLAEAVPLGDAVALSAAPLLGELVAARRPDALLLGPDEESAQWVEAAAAAGGLAHAVCVKTRHGDREVDIALPPLAFRDRPVVLLDDVASSGRTLARAAALLQAAGASSIDVAVTHALFAADALDAILAAGVGEVWSTDCINHSSNALSVAPLLAEALRRIGFVGGAAALPG
ncbi:MAG: ribose-phosphate diphosphokinase [Thauera phenolivorans]|uniref:Ribose-phosphate diphosphokinase n=1 Tax=Thauera phenolivorans TaxID=1792543 RepID=A0A7X7LV04_9RHOO|nr:ribose-phosphate diphosphokinase [Thauera phenolivorans]